MLRFSVCTDQLTTAKKGVAEVDFGDTNDRWCTFVVLAQNTVIDVTCTVGEAGINVENDSVSVSWHLIVKPKSWTS